MKLARKLATLAKSLTRRSRPQQKRAKQPLSNNTPERLTDEHRLELENSPDEGLEQVRIAELLQRRTRPSTESGKNEKESSDE